MEPSPPDAAAAPPHATRTAVNWVLALLTAVGALAVVGYAYVRLLGAAACSPDRCGGMGPSATVFGIVEYGTPLVAVVAVALSFATARRAFGIAVPVVALALVAAAAIVLFDAF